MTEQEQLENRIKRNTEKIKLFELNKEKINNKITINHLQKEINELKLMLNRLRDAKKENY